MQLQRVWPALEAAGYALYAVSYDRRAKLEAFADEHGIGFPLLADFGSTTIRRLGLLNDRIVEEHARYGIQPRPLHRGVAHPGTFVLDGDGRVVAARFYESYRERDTGATLVRELLGLEAPPPDQPAAATTTAAQPADEPPPEASTPARVRVWLDDAEWAWYQRNRLHVAMDLDDGWHAYVEPVPDGYVPLAVAVEAPDDVVVHAADMPEGRPHRIDGLDEQFVVVDDGAEVIVPLTFVTQRGSGPVRLRVHVTYQACDDRTCLVPQRLTTVLEVPEAPTV